MYSTDKKQQLKDFATAISVPVGLTDSAKWPVRAGMVIFPVRNILVREFLEQIKKADLIGDDNAWRKAFNNPTQLWRMSHHLIAGLLDDEVDKKEIAETILLFLEGIAALSYAHYFERIGKHLILDETVLNKAVSIPMISKKSDARSILALCGIIWSYSETNFFVAHELTCEYHGAYPLSDGNYAVIRDFINISPVELWGERDYSGLPNKIRAITIHNNTLDIGFDAYNNLFDDKGTMAQSLIGGAVVSDNNVLTLEEIESLIEIFSSKVLAFSDEVDSMSKDDIAKKYMEVFWYRKKSLADYIGVDWKPTTEQYKILDEGLKKGMPKKSGRKVTLEELAEQYDFSEFLSGGKV